ncbi:TolC family protein [Nitrosococcus wardiae]|uniref:TolC family protein n=1 Tax=Nitrosococcus wardiae TaxID=1814290 RepID=A0A4P7BZV3_9GAMM|nr:TolC family protein [Nitrosococcus wardiae]QBQ55661.1 TolC family protein [Nitrosococcus wardiae]
MLSKHLSLLLLTTLPALTGGCRAYSPPVGEPTNATLLEQTSATISPTPAPLVQKFKEASQSIPQKAIEPTGELTLEEVAAFALLQNPELAVFSQEVRAREAAVLQAGLLPNPQLSIQGSNLANSRLKSFDGPSTTVQLSQLILLGGKIAKRVKAAQLTQDLAGWDYEAKRVEVLTQVAQSFITVLSAQERLALAQQLVRLAEQVATTVSKRVQAGKISPVEETKAQVALSSVRIELTRAKRELRVARNQLAAVWGSTTPRFQKAVGQLNELSPLPSLEQLAQLVRQNPDLARWTNELAQRQALIDLEKSKAIPDLTVSFGGTEYADTGDYALVAGISIPLPLFDRNQGGIAEAQRRLTKAEEERRAVEVQVATALSSAYQRLATAHAEATILQTQVLPGAQSAFDAVNQGFRLGKFDFLSVLDAQRTLFDSKSQYLQALTDYHQAVAEVERLIGERLEAASNIEG